jgi:hypothetical protein
MVIFLLKKVKTGKWKETGLSKDNINGYYHLCFKRKKKYVHRLMMEVFYNCEIPDNLTVDHIDRNIHNNNIDNLRFATQAMQHENRKNTKFSSEEIAKLGSQSNEYKVALAKRNGYKRYADYLYYLRHGIKR